MRLPLAIRILVIELDKDIRCIIAWSLNCDIGCHGVISGHLTWNNTFIQVMNLNYLQRILNNLSFSYTIIRHFLLFYSFSHRRFLWWSFSQNSVGENFIYHGFKNIYQNGWKIWSLYHIFICFNCCCSTNILLWS